jgi:succinate dehydrogenase / fumarate reductase iron-sulfur subunit
MCTTTPSIASTERRTVLVRLIATLQLIIGGVLTFVLGGAAIGPALARRGPTWLRAANLDAVHDGELLPVTLRVARQDGYTTIVDRKAIYLVRNGTEISAISSTCTHLGCRTSYDRASGRIVCPCHGGVYDRQGNVLEGPPPAPLPRLVTRIEDGQIFVQV